MRFTRSLKQYHNFEKRARFPLSPDVYKSDARLTTCEMYTANNVFTLLLLEDRLAASGLEPRTMIIRQLCFVFE